MGVGWLLAGAGAILLLMPKKASAARHKSKKSAGRSVGGGRRVLNPASVAKLIGKTLAGGANDLVTAKQAAVAKGMLEGFARGGLLTPQEQVMLLAFGWHETRWNPAAIGVVDSKWGNSYTVFQLRRNVELQGAMDALGLSMEDVVPGAGQTASAEQIANQARCAEWLAKQKRILKIRERAGGDDDEEMLDLCLLLLNSLGPLQRSRRGRLRPAFGLARSGCCTGWRPIVSCGRRC